MKRNKLRKFIKALAFTLCIIIGLYYTSLFLCLLLVAIQLSGELFRSTFGTITLAVIALSIHLHYRRKNKD